MSSSAISHSPIRLHKQAVSVLSVEEDDRIIEMIVSPEILDYQNEIVDISGTLKVMPIWFRRGAVIIDRHTNWPCGQGLDWHSTTYKGYPAVWLKLKIFSDYLNDDRVWNDIQNGHLVMNSIGAESRIEFQECDDNKCWNRIKEYDLFELSMVDAGANPLSDVIKKEWKSLTKSVVSSLNRLFEVKKKCHLVIL